jgi:hypothetical protein
MTYTTDERLKGYLDTNQLQRERMCLAILAIDKRFTNVRPRHPRGGPDGGRDIEATFQGEQNAIGAIGFVNQANDSQDHKRKSGPVCPNSCPCHSSITKSNGGKSLDLETWDCRGPKLEPWHSSR